MTCVLLTNDPVPVGDGTVYKLPFTSYLHIAVPTTK